jgi:hypothetical protein
MPRLRHAIGRFLIPGMTAVTLLVTGCSSGSNPRPQSAAAAASPSQVSAAPSAGASPPISASPSSTPTVPAPPKNSIELTCSPDQLQSSIQTFTVTADVKGIYDFRAVWKAEEYGCDISAVNGSPQTVVKATTALQKQALKKADNGESDITALVQECASASATDVYLSDTFGMADDQIALYSSVLMLCPSHPHASAWRKAMKGNDDQADSDLVKNVHPGAFCSPEGARGYTSAGTLMKCSYTSGDTRARWRRA